MPIARPRKPLFISHAVDDRELVESFAALLKQGLGLADRHIYCVTTDSPEIGEDFGLEIRKRLNDAPLVIELLSRHFYSRPFCLNEMGAAWASQKKIFPLLIPPLSHGELKGVVTSDVQAPPITSTDALPRLRRAIAKAGFAPSGTGWEPACSRFVSSLPGILEKLEMKRQAKSTDLFISAPMSSIPGSDYALVRDMAMSVGSALVGEGRYYFAGVPFKARSEFDQRSVAARKDVDRLKGCLAYVLLIPIAPKVPSSVHFEAGIAVANGLHCTFLTHKDVKLPFMMAEAHKAFQNLRSLTFSSPSGLQQMLKNPSTRDAIFPGRRALLKLEDVPLLTNG